MRKLFLLSAVHIFVGCSKSYLSFRDISPDNCHYMFIKESKEVKSLNDVSPFDDVINTLSDTIEGRIRYKKEVSVCIKSSTVRSEIVTVEAVREARKKSDTTHIKGIMQDFLCCIAEKRDTSLLLDSIHSFTYRDSFTSVKNVRENVNFEVFNETIERGFIKNGFREGDWYACRTCRKDFIDVTLATPDDFTKDLYMRRYLKYLNEHYHNGYRHGKYIYYDFFSRKIIYKTKFKNGTGYYKDFYHSDPMTIKSEGQYEKGIKVGNWIYYDVNGKSKVVFEGNPKNNTLFKSKIE